MSGLETQRRKPQRTKRTNDLPPWAKEAIGQSQDQYGDTEAVQIARRVMEDYGGERALRRLIEMFEKGVYGQEIARKFGISKQRVSQWRRALGYVEEKFVPRQVVCEALTRGFDAA